MRTTREVRIQQLTSKAYAPFGWVLGTESTSSEGDYFDGTELKRWHEHDFEVGEGGVVEFLWIQYKLRPFSLVRLESHRLTEQALIPVDGKPMIHVVCPPPSCPSRQDIIPDLERLTAFLLDGSVGVCMKQGCWHWHFPLVDCATYLMVTRRSTSEDLDRAIESRTALTETVVREIGALTDTALQFVL
jgi:ureidoglycolate lyase